MELFKDKDGDASSYTSPMLSVRSRIGKFYDGQIVIGEEILEVEPYEVSNDSDKIYLITKDPPNQKVPSMFIHYPFQCLLCIP